MPGRQGDLDAFQLLVALVAGDVDAEAGEARRPGCWSRCASKLGAKGRSPSVFAQAPPPGAEVRVNSPDGVAAGLPDQGVIVATVLCGPQIAGLVSVARGPPSSFSTKELNGTWGSS